MIIFQKANRYGETPVVVRHATTLRMLATIVCVPSYDAPKFPHAYWLRMANGDYIGHEHRSVDEAKDYARMVFQDQDPTEKEPTA